MTNNKAPYISKAVDNPDQPNSGKWFKHQPQGPVLVFGRQPSMPWHKVCKCGHSEKSHTHVWCLECDCEKFTEAGKNDR